MRHPCLAELQALQHPYRVTVHGASIREDFGFLTKAHNLVLSGVSSFADSAALLSRYRPFLTEQLCRIFCTCLLIFSLSLFAHIVRIHYVHARVYTLSLVAMSVHRNACFFSTFAPWKPCVLGLYQQRWYPPRSLRTLYAFGWQSGESWSHEANPTHTIGSFASYHDLPGVDVRRYVAHHYMPYWTREGVQYVHNTTEVCTHSECPFLLPSVCVALRVRRSTA